MLIDILNFFGKNIDPANTGTSAKWLGDVVDLRSGTYARFGDSGQDSNIALGNNKFNVHFSITTTFDTGTSRDIRFLVGTSDAVASGVLSSGTVLVQSKEYSLTTTTNEATKGVSFSLTLPTAANYKRYLGVGIITSVSDNNEAGRFNAWLNPADYDGELRFVRNRGWTN